MSSVGKYFSGCYSSYLFNWQQIISTSQSKNLSTTKLNNLLAKPNSFTITRDNLQFSDVSDYSNSILNIEASLLKCRTSAERFLGLGKIENIEHLKFDCLIKQFYKNSRNVKYFCSAVCTTSFWHVIISIQHLKSCFNTLRCLHLLKHIYLNIVIWWLWAE